MKNNSPEQQQQALRKTDVSGALLAVKIEEALAKYWYDTEYNYIDKSNHEKAEDSRLRFRKWIYENLEAFSKE